eukprot:TRINITY_DN8521_c0_g1_i1.p1 TRINITY_DN8521_c0_g1~~TRINITY_DN8521_c0_g1_i1.p1  ORF type:complete len:248 (+),score=67.73 TRINITY_DN8521_c0_g1_i1:869-1612(+)
MNRFDGTAPIYEDKRVHILFYFIAPHRLKEIDIEFMKRLAPIVNIVPLIAKVDSMTKDEKKQFTQLIEDRLEEEKIPVYVLSEKTEKKVYSIISSEQHNRVYEWGTADVNNRSHSDVLLLRELIIQQRFCDVFSETNRKTNLFMKRNWISRKLAVASKKNMDLLRVLLGVMFFFLLFGACYAFSVWMLQEEFKPFELPEEEKVATWSSLIPNITLPALPQIELPHFDLPQFNLSNLPSFNVSIPFFN